MSASSSSSSHVPPPSGTPRPSLTPAMPPPAPIPQPPPSSSSSSTPPVYTSYQDAKNAEKVVALVKSLEIQQAVTNIMKRILPSHMAIDPAAAELVTDCMLEFASSMSFEALGVAGQEGRAAVVGKDFETAVRLLGFEDYADPISEYELKRQRHILLSSCTQCNGKIEPPKFKSAASLQKKKYIRKTKETANSTTATETSTENVQTHDTNKTTAESQKVASGSTNNANAGKATTTTTTTPSEATAVSATADSSTIQPEKKERKQAKRTNWLDPVFIEEFTLRMNEALSNDDPNTLLRKISKEMNISMNTLKQKFEE